LALAAVRAEAQPAAVASAVAAAPLPRSFREVAALVAEAKEATLHAHLRHSVHLVRYAAPVIELRPEPEAPRDLSQRLAQLLLQITGTRWTIAVSSAAGEPTLDAQGQAADSARREDAAQHPLVQAILTAFPGARIEEVQDSRADAYGLMPEPAPDIPDFAPPDAALADLSFEDGPPDPWENDA
ncbi:MAG: DNA polymerase III subunit gamma/tau, partial [Rhodospirillales bacterium]|nr:DNA polymerase III subunit gamma/tau [Rhodospirillales bacterium]